MSKSRLLSLVDWVNVLGVYVPILWGVVVVILSVQVFHTLYEHRYVFDECTSSDRPPPSLSLFL